MVASHYVAEDKAVLDLREKSVGDDEIVDTPPDVLFSCLHHIAPPGIFDLVGVKRAEGIGESGREKLWIDDFKFGPKK
jgi:hypothetical protein